MLVRNNAKGFKAVLWGLLVQRNQKGKRQQFAKAQPTNYAFTNTNKLTDKKSPPPGAKGTKECTRVAHACRPARAQYTDALLRGVLRHPTHLSCPLMRMARRPWPDAASPNTPNMDARQETKQFTSVHTCHAMHDRRRTKCWCSKYKRRAAHRGGFPQHRTAPGPLPAAAHARRVPQLRHLACALLCARAKPAREQTHATGIHSQTIRSAAVARAPALLNASSGCAHLQGRIGFHPHTQCAPAASTPTSTPRLRHTTHRLATSRLLRGFRLKPALKAQAQGIGHILARTAGVKGVPPAR